MYDGTSGVIWCSAPHSPVHSGRYTSVDFLSKTRSHGAPGLHQVQPGALKRVLPSLSFFLKLIYSCGPAVKCAKDNKMAMFLFFREVDSFTTRVAVSQVSRYISSVLIIYQGVSFHINYTTSIWINLLHFFCYNVVESVI